MIDGVDHTTLDQRVIYNPIFKLKTAVMKIVSLLAVSMLIFEAVLLFVGVVFRYFLHSPLLWSDELAQSVFLWLCMFGAAIALDRNGHMRLTAFISRCTLRKQIWLHTFGMTVVLVFAVALVTPAFFHAIEQMAITSPALNIPDGYRAMGIPIALSLFILITLSDLLSKSKLVDIASSLLLVALVGYGLWYFSDALYDLENYNLLVFFVLLLGACVFMGVPIAFSFGIATLAYIIDIAGAPTMIVISRMDEGSSQLVLLAVPLFIFLGVLLQLSGMAKALIDFMASLLGHVKGGLNYVLLGAMFLVSGISGSKVADMAAVAPALFPEMKKRGSDERELAAMLAATGAMTETIPPSLVLITIGAVCGVSISALFIAGLLPALVCMIALALMCYVQAKKVKLEKIQKATKQEILRTFLIALPVLLLPVLIRVCVVEGVATATEVASVGLVYVLVYAFIYQAITKSLSFNNTYTMLVEAVSLAGSILLIIGVATSMAWALTQSGFSHALVDFMKSIPGGIFGFMTISIVIFVILGSVLEGIPAIVLFGPLIFPAAKAMGIHDVHYSMVIILAMGIGLFAPPLGVGFYSACAISKVNPDEVMSRTWKYLFVVLLMTFVVAYVPWISTGLL